MISITRDNYEPEILQAENPVLFEFYSDSCIPCKRMSPILAELEEQFTEMKFAKLNINFGIEIAQKYGVMSSPTIIFLKNGEEVSRVFGVTKKEELEKKINEVLK